MRVLQVNKYLYRRGGAEGYMLDLADLQRQRGDDVEFFSMDHPENPPATYERTFAPYMELDPPPTGIGARAGVAVGMVWNRKAQRAMDAVLADFRPDVVHLHNVYHQLSPSVLRPLREIPTVMTLHDYKLACPTYQFLDHGSVCEACLGRRFHHAVARKCNAGSRVASAVVAGELAWHTITRAYVPVDVFVCPSEFLLGKMRDGKVFPDRLHHLRHFAMLQGIAPADCPGRGVVVAGRLSGEKGVDVAVDAMAHLPETTLTVCGDGPERAALEARAAAGPAADRITFAGRLDAGRLHATMRQAAVVVVPSRWYENQPMIVLEALACGRPVVASDIGGLPELVRPGVDGALVPANDPAALAAAVRRIVADPVAAAEMGRRGRQRTFADFGVDAHLDGLAELYALAGAARRS